VYISDHFYTLNILQVILLVLNINDNILMFLFTSLDGFRRFDFSQYFKRKGCTLIILNRQ